VSFAVPDWIETLHRSWQERHRGEVLGSARLIDEAARLRAVSSVVSGKVVSLSRPLQVARFDTPERTSRYHLEQSIRQVDRMVLARDRLTVDNHGYPNTHLDGLNHIGVDGTWCDGSPASLDGSTSSIKEWAEHGLITRGVFIDVASGRDGGWVEPGRPVTAGELAAAERRAGVDIEPGDAVLLRMGRDRYEADGRLYEAFTIGAGPTPGIGEDGIRWLADRQPSMLLWDFLEASESPLIAHMLIWAVGLLLVDNCDFALCCSALQNREHQAGLVAIAPLRLARATGCPVNPLFLY